MRKKAAFFRGFLLAALAVSLFLIGCEQGTTTVDTLAAPTNVVVTPGQALGEIIVTWNAVAGASVYEVQYDKNTPAQQVQASAAGGRAAVSVQVTVAETISGLDDNAEYNVKVRAGNGSIWSAWSVSGTGETVTVTGTPSAMPEFRGGWAAYEIGSSTDDDNTVIQQWYSQGRNAKDADLLSGVVMASWKPVLGATGYDVYVIKHEASEWEDDGTGKMVLIDGQPSSPPDEPVLTDYTRVSYFVRDVEAGGGATIWVQSKNDKGSGPISAPFTLWLSDAKGIQLAGYTVTGADNVISINPDGYDIIERAEYPKNVKANVTASGTVSLSWDMSDRAVWYEVYYHTADIPLRKPNGGAGSGPPPDWDMNGAGMGGFINGMTDVKGGRPDFFSAVPYLKFTATATNNLQDVATPWNDKESTAGTVGNVYKIHSTQTVITGLDSGRSYYFWIRSLNHNGEQSIAKTAQITPSLSSDQSLTPINVQVKPVSPGGGGMLDVSWYPVANADSYQVYYSPYSDVETALSVEAMKVGGVLQPSARLYGLLENTLYYVWVTAKRGTAQSALSAGVTGIPNQSDGTEVVRTKKEAVWGEPLKNYVYVEVNNEDPRVALGYHLEGTNEKYFDTVILFAANIRVRNCALETNAAHGCTRNGPHIHYNENVRHILENRDKYIKPLQDAGIKVLLGLLEDHDNFAYHSLGAWPFESTFPWADNTEGQNYHASWWTGDPTEYPFGPEIRDAFIQELTDDIKRYGLDGFDLDDEYAYDTTVKGLAMRPSEYYDNNNDVERDTIQDAVSKNLAEFIYIARQKLGEEAIISIYDHNQFQLWRHSADRATFTGNGEEPIRNVWKYATQGGWSMYGSAGDPKSLAVPNSQYAPFAINFGTKLGSTDYNMYFNSEPKYGHIMHFNLISLKTQGTLAVWQGTSIADWLSSTYGYNFFGQNIVYRGVDYPKDW